MSTKQSAHTPQRKRLSYKDKAAIIEAAKKGGGKEAVRDKMMSDYQISRSAYYAIFRNFEPKMATVQPNAKSDKRVKTEIHEIFEKRLFLWIVATTNENGVMLGGEFIKEKAKEIAKELNITDTQYGNHRPGAFYFVKSPRPPSRTIKVKEEAASRQHPEEVTILR